MAITDKPRLIVGVSGASGVAYGLRALAACRELGVESHLVMSRSSALTLDQETALSVADVQAMADVAHKVGDVGASIASGSFQTLGMIVAPCSVRTLGEIAQGVTSSLLSRAADVCLKERRRLVLLFREAPLHAGHIRNMLAVTEMGAIVAPPVPAFYTRPRTIDDLVDHSVSRALDLFGLDTKSFPRWAGPDSAKRKPR